MQENLYYAGWVIDGMGKPAKPSMLLRVKNGLISSLESANPAELGASGIEYADLSACTILPGFVDCHIHLAWSGRTDPKMREEQLGYGFERSGPLIGERIEKSLSFGIMALRDGGDSAGHTLRYVRQDFPANDLPVYVKCAGKGWRARGRYGKLVGGSPKDGITLAESIRTHSAEADHVKIVNSGLNSLTLFGKETQPQFKLEELKAAADTAHLRGQKVMVHANGRLPVQLAIEAECDSIEHGFFTGKDNIKRMADRQVCWVPTAFTMKALCMNMPAGSLEADVAFRNLEHQQAQMVFARELGAPVAVGTDAGGLGVRHGRAFAEEMKILMQAGYGPEEVIRCASFEGARLLGLERELGCLVKGMPANFVAIKGPPSSMPGSLYELGAVYVRGKKIV